MRYETAIPILEEVLGKSDQSFGGDESRTFECGLLIAPSLYELIDVDEHAYEFFGTDDLLNGGAAEQAKTRNGIWYWCYEPIEFAGVTHDFSPASLRKLATAIKQFIEAAPR